MKRLLNERTGTVHKFRPGTTSDETACGALRHVERRNVVPVALDDHTVGEEMELCGRCFEDAGGY